MLVASDPEANIIMENHEFGMPPAHYAEWPVLNRTYNILSTTRDRRAYCAIVLQMLVCLLLYTSAVFPQNSTILTHQYYYLRRVFLSGGCSRVCVFCDPVQPGGRLGWCRGYQRVEKDACLAFGAGGVGRCILRPPIAPAPARVCAVKERAPHWSTSAPLPPHGHSHIAARA